MTGTSMTGASAVLRRTAAVGFSLALAWGITSCAGNGAGAEEPTAGASAGPSSESASVSPTPSPTPTPSATYSPASAAGPAQNVPLPVMPDIAREKSKEGLEAFTRYFYETASYAYETGDLGPLEMISGPNCVTCNFIINQVEKGYLEEDWIARGRLSVLAVTSEFLETSDATYQAVADVKQEDIDFYAPAPEGHLSTNTGPAESFAQLIEGMHTDGAWKAGNIITLSL